jgi:hypothetical protein
MREDIFTTETAFMGVRRESRAFATHRANKHRYSSYGYGRTQRSAMSIARPSIVYRQSVLYCRPRLKRMVHY